MKSLERGPVPLPPKTSDITPLNLKFTSNWQLATRAQPRPSSLSIVPSFIPLVPLHMQRRYRIIVPWYRPGLLIASIKQCIASVLLATTVSTQQTLSSTWLEEKRITLRMQGRRYLRQSNTVCSDQPGENSKCFVFWLESRHHFATSSTSHMPRFQRSSY